MAQVKKAQDINTIDIELSQMTVAQDVATMDGVLDIDIKEIQFTVPAEGATFDPANVTFEWTDSESRTIFRLIVSPNVDLSSPVIDRVIEGNSFVADGLLTSGVTYYRQLIAQNITDLPAIVPDAADSQAGDTQWANDFYAATDGDNWTNNTGWNGGDVTLQVGDYADPPYGLRCATINGEVRITGIDLVGNNLINGVEVGTDSFGKIVYSVISGREVPDTFDVLKHCEYLNIKGNIVGGQFPHSLSRMPKVQKILLQGRDPNDGSINTFKDPDPQGENHPGKQRNKDEMFFSGAFPQDWSLCQELMDIEITTDGKDITLTGDIPHSLFQLPKFRIFLAFGNYFTGTLPEVPNPSQALLANIQIGGSNSDSIKYEITGPLPSSWGLCPDLNYIRVVNSEITGGFPQQWKDNMTGLRIFGFSKNEGLVDTFPTFVVNGSSPSVYYLMLDDTGIYGELPDDSEVGQTSFSVFRLRGSDITGPIKNWVANIRHVQFRMNSVGFTGLGSEFYNPDADIYDNLRFFDVSYNNIDGQELPDVVFTRVDFSGITQSQNQLDIGIQTDLGIVYTGTVTQTTGTGGDWYRDIEADDEGSNPWPNNWIGYEITLIDPDGIEPNRRYVNTSGTNWESGYFYPRGAIDLNTGSELDIGGIVGWTYEIRPLAVNKIIRFKRGENDYIPRRIVSHTDFAVTMDREIEEDVVGMEYFIHDISSPESGDFLELQTRSNGWVGKIPESYAYIPTSRSLSWMQMGNGYLTGIVPDFTLLGNGLGGDANRVYIQNNKFLPRDILPNLVNNSTLNTFDYSNQKPFSDPMTFEVAEGSDIFIDDFVSLFEGTGYTFSWEKDGVEVGTNVELGIFNLQTSDWGLYKLIVTHQDLTGTWESETIEIKEPEEIIT